MFSVLRHRQALGALVLLGLLAFPAHAENPVAWDFFVQTTGGDASWASPTQLDTGFPDHNYSYTLEQLDLLLDFGVAEVWQSFLSQVPTEQQSGSGSFAALPVSFLDALVAEGELSVNASVGIDEFGQGYADLSDVQLGEALGFTIAGIRIGGDIQVTAVPEPTSVFALMGIGAAVLGRRRKTD